MSLRQAAQQALEALEDIADELISPYNDPIGKAILDLRTALAEPEQEPVAWRFHDGAMWCYVNHMVDLPAHKFEPLYTHPVDDTALLRQALSTLEGWANYGKWVWPESALEQAKRNTEEAITALRERQGEKT